MNRSRLAKRLEKQTIKNLFLSILGIVIIVGALIKFGIPLLVDFTFFISGEKKALESNAPNATAFILPPVLNPQLAATNSAQTQILGSASPKQTIDLYINGNLVGKSQTTLDGNFVFLVTLNSGENTIRARATTFDGNESNLSETLTIIFKSDAPSLEIKSPSDGQFFSKDQNTVEIKGTTDSHVRVTINNFWAIIDDNNNFSYTLALKDGENEIKILAQDQAGNKTEKSIRVTYSP
jgi:bacillopeptidase F